MTVNDINRIRHHLNEYAASLASRASATPDQATQESLMTKRTAVLDYADKLGNVEVLSTIAAMDPSPTRYNVT